MLFVCDNANSDSFWRVKSTELLHGMRGDSFGGKCISAPRLITWTALILLQYPLTFFLASQSFMISLIDCSRVASNSSNWLKPSAIRCRKTKDHFCYGKGFINSNHDRLHSSFHSILYKLYQERNQTTLCVKTSFSTLALSVPVRAIKVSRPLGKHYYLRV